MKLRDYLKIGAALAVASVLAGCGGGGSGGGAATFTGAFIDAEVGGVSYSNAPSGVSGVTNAAGEYNFRSGDTVTFSVGSVVLGSAPATGVMTPAVLAAAAPGMTSEQKANMARNISIFLQTFDDDGNPDNGITISAAVVAAATGSINFNQTSGAFREDATLTQLASDTNKEVVSEADAAEHSNRTIARLLEGSWMLLDPTDQGAEMAVLTFLPTVPGSDVLQGEYILGVDHDGLDQNCVDGVEYGSYTLDVNTGDFSTEAWVDNTGSGEEPRECGLNDPNELVTPTLLIDSETQITLYYSEEDQASLEKIPTDGLTGSWVENGQEDVVLTRKSLQGSVVSVATLLASGDYMVAQVAGDPGELGVEVGTYAVGQGGELTVTTGTDTNGEAGLSDIPPGTTIEVGAFGRLEATVPEDGVFVFSPSPYVLSLEGESAYSQIAYYACEAYGYLDYAFGPSSMTWDGTGTRDVACPLLDPEVVVVSYDEVDGPFNCGGPSCDFLDLNKSVTGIDGDERPFEAIYSHAAGSDEARYDKQITGGEDEGYRWEETVYLGEEQQES